MQGRPEEDSAILRDLLFWDRTKNKSFVVKRQRGGVKDAELEYALLEALPELSLLRVILHTGRTHQIRVQFSSRAMPLGFAGIGAVRSPCGRTLSASATPQQAKP